jgi:hypothetical protein
MSGESWSDSRGPPSGEGSAGEGSAGEGSAGEGSAGEGSLGPSLAAIGVSSSDVITRPATMVARRKECRNAPNILWAAYARLCFIPLNESGLAEAIQKIQMLRGLTR